jgi:hypothetical protein
VNDRCAGASGAAANGSDGRLPSDPPESDGARRRSVIPPGSEKPIDWLMIGKPVE